LERGSKEEEVKRKSVGKRGKNKIGGKERGCPSYTRLNQRDKTKGKIEGSSSVRAEGEEGGGKTKEGTGGKEKK